MKTVEEVIDAVANDSPPYWNHTDIIHALDAAGFVIVPKEPTKAMLRRSGDRGPWSWEIWRCMIEAAKEKPAESED